MAPDSRAGAAPGFFGLSEWAEEFAQFRGEQFGFFGGGEVAAPRHLGPAGDVVALLGPLPWAGDRVLFRGKRDADGYVDANRLWRLGIVAAVVVEEEGGVDRAGYPVEGGDRQELVLGEAALDVAVAVAPGAELVDNPGRQASRRIVQAVGQSLRVGALLVRVAAFGVTEVLLSGQERLPLLADSSILRRECEHAGQVETADQFRMLRRETDADGAADVLPLGAEA